MTTAEMARAINHELDRLGWSSDTAPEGNTCVDAFPTTSEGVVAIEDTQETTCMDGEGLLGTLQGLTPPLAWEELWCAMLPHMVDN